jgi:NADH dehydrogenase [ubiquinone] 1 alpha subcomplex assembly factor 3
MSYLRAVRRSRICHLPTFLLSPHTEQPGRRCLDQSINTTDLLTRRISPNATRALSLSRTLNAAPKSHDRGPPSTEDTQTDFGSLNVLGNTPAPSTSIDACLWDGFHLDSGVKITGGSGVLLVAGEAFSWRPWEAGNGDFKLVNEKGQFDLEDEAWGLLSLVWPKPGEPSSSFKLVLRVLLKRCADD